MKADEVRTKTPDQLKADLVQLQKEQFNLRFQRASGQLENTARVRAVRQAGFTQIMLMARDLVGHPDGFDAAVRAVKQSGLRVTDDAALEVALGVLRGVIKRGSDA